MATSNTLQGDPNGPKHRKEAGAYLRDLRKRAEITQQELARSVGLDYYTTISQIERGQTRVPPDKLEAFAKALNVPPRAFVERLLSHYDPYSWKVLFGGNPADGDGVK